MLHILPTFFPPHLSSDPNQALNRLAEYLKRQGAALRVYAPTVTKPAFEPTGDLVSVPSLPFPIRPEYRMPLGLSRQNRKDLAAFKPDIVHVSSPDPTGHAALRWAQDHDIPVDRKSTRLNSSH